MRQSPLFFTLYLLYIYTLFFETNIIQSFNTLFIPPETIATISQTHPYQAIGSDWIHYPISCAFYPQGLILIPEQHVDLPAGPFICSRIGLLFISDLHVITDQSIGYHVAIVYQLFQYI